MSWSDKYKSSINCDNPKGFSQKAHCRGKKKKMDEATVKVIKEEPRIPKKSGQPDKSDKHSDLYTDEDPIGTIQGLGFKDVATAKKSVSKIKTSDRSHAHKIQAAIAMEQRAKVAGKSSEAAIYRKFIDSMKEKTKEMKEAKENQDHEISMAKKQVSKSIDNLQKLARVLAKKSDRDNLPAWVQAKLTDTEHNTDAAASYIGEEKKKCGEGKYWCKTDKKCKLIPAGYHTMPNGNLMKDDEHEESGDMSEGKRDGKSAKDPGYSLKDWFNDEWVQTGGKYDGKPCAKQPGQTTKPFCRDPDDRASMSKDERERRVKKKRREDPNPNRRGNAKIVSASYEPKGEQLQEKPGDGYLGPTPIPNPIRLAKDVVDATNRTSQKQVDTVNKLLGPGTASMPKTTYFNKGPSAASQKYLGLKNSYEPEGETIEEKKDACYHKVKSRYKIWPSAYASGALVKCRKVGVANWGNKSESYEFSNWRDEFFPTEVETVNIIEPESLKASKGIGSQLIDEAGKKCWPGYKKKGTQKLFGKTYNRCVKERYSNWREELTEDWQKVNRQDKTDGLSQKAVNAYRRENPGSKLQTAVTEKNPSGKRASRRKSFCRRMKGMKSELTSAKTARDPDSNINKALRRWNCN